MYEILYIVVGFLLGHFVGAKGWRSIKSSLAIRKQQRLYVTAEERDMLLGHKSDR